jgi:GTP-binding protein
LARLGVEEQLLAQGATPGCTVMIGGDDAVVFDWHPTILAGQAPHAGPRGSDVRLEARLDELDEGRP